MNDIKTDIFLKYGLEVKKMSKGRMALIAETDKGLKRLIQYNKTTKRLRYIESLLTYLKERGFKGVDLICRNLEDELYTVWDDEKYILTDWFYGKECDVMSKNDIMKSSMALAVMHKIAENMNIEEDGENIVPTGMDLVTEYEKHNREIRKVKKYIRNRRNKSEFEYAILDCIDKYYMTCEDSLCSLYDSEYNRLLKEGRLKNSICHGNYNYHNIMIGHKDISIVNFWGSERGLQIKDLYMFLRKVMEKHGWDVEVGHGIIENYNKIKSISKDELEILKVMISYPEKFWKLINHYYNGDKSWFLKVAIEKLETFHLQQFKKEEFVKHL